jgi:hypothetical protein
MKTKSIGVLGTGSDKLIRRFKNYAIIYSAGSGYCIYRCETQTWSNWDEISNWCGRYYGSLADCLDEFFNTLFLFGTIKSKK